MTGLLDILKTIQENLKVTRSKRRLACNAYCQWFLQASTGCHQWVGGITSFQDLHKSCFILARRATVVEVPHRR